jgi:hypothetical protein
MDYNYGFESFNDPFNFTALLAALAVLPALLLLLMPVVLVTEDLTFLIRF